MIYYFTPYAITKDYLAAIDMHMRIINVNEWACIRDGDTMFLNDYGKILNDYVNKYPDTGLFTCYANRCHYACQRIRNSLMNIPDILYHKKLADKIYNDNKLQVIELDRKIAGHLMLIKKSTWVLIRDEVRRKIDQKNKKILGVDTEISRAILKRNLTIRLMKGMYIFHFLRFDKSMSDNKHLL